MERGRTRRVGALAAVIALAFLWVVAGISNAVVFPPTSLAGALVRETPGDVATFFIELLGHWALRLATLGALAGAVAAGAEALVRTAAPERPRPFVAGAVLAVLSGLAAAVEPSEEISPVPMALTLVVAVAIYGVAAKALAASDDSHETTDLGRRRVLKLGTGGVMAIAVGGGVIGWFVRRLGGPDRNVAIADALVPARVPARPPFPEIAGLTEEITTPEAHYVIDINLVQPTVEADSWSLPIMGEVAKPFELDFSSLQSEFEVVEHYSVLSCISNEVGGPLVGHSAWRGVRLRDVVEQAGPNEGVVDVVFTGADGYKDSIPLEVARDPAVLLTFAQNGEPLSREHGFPCRVRVPAIYGMKNVKWLQSIELVTIDYQGYWMDRGWSDRAIVKTQSRIDVAGDDGGAKVGAETWIAGVAWAGDRGVSAVEVSTDGGGTWEPAEVKEPISDNSWRLWAFRWTPQEAGSATVLCRAIDGEGAVQSAEETPPHPAGSSGYHSVEVDVG